MRGERIRLTEDAVLTTRHTYELIREEGSRHAALMRSVVLAKKLGLSIENQWNLKPTRKESRLLPYLPSSEFPSHPIGKALRNLHRF